MGGGQDYIGRKVHLLAIVVVANGGDNFGVYVLRLFPRDASKERTKWRRDLAKILPYLFRCAWPAPGDGDTALLNPSEPSLMEGGSQRAWLGKSEHVGRAGPEHGAGHMAQNEGDGAGS